MITALVLLNVERSKVNTVAEMLAEMNGVSEVYSIAGRYDLAVVIRARDNDADGRVGDRPYAQGRRYHQVRDAYRLPRTLPPRSGQHVLHRNVAWYVQVNLTSGSEENIIENVHKIVYYYPTLPHV